MVKLLKTVLHYFTGVLASRIIQFLFLPIYTAYIATDAFGYYDLAVTIIGVALPLLFQSIWDGILRLGMDMHTDEDRQAFYSTVICYSAGISVFIAITGVVLWLGFGFRYMQYIALMTVGSGLLQIWNASTRAMQDSKAYAIGNVTSSTISILVNVILIVWLKMGLEALFIANFTASILTVIVIELRIRILRFVRPRWISKIMFQNLFQYIRSFIVATTAWQFLNVSGRILVPFLLGFNANGIYSISMRFPAILGVITLVYNMAWQEEMIRRADHEEKSIFFNSVLRSLMNFGIGALFVVLPVTFLIFPVMVHGDYIQAIRYVPILYFEAILAMMTGHLTSVFIMAKNTRYNLIDTITGVAVSIGLTILLAHFFGLYGVAAAMLAATFYRFILDGVLIRKYIQLSFNWIIFISLAALYVALAVLLGFIHALTTAVVVLPVCIVIALFLNRKMIRTVVRQIKPAGKVL